MLYGPLIRIGPEVLFVFLLSARLVTWSMYRGYNSPAPGNLLADYHLAYAHGFVFDF